MRLHVVECVIGNRSHLDLRLTPTSLSILRSRIEEGSQLICLLRDVVDGMIDVGLGSTEMV